MLYLHLYTDSETIFLFEAELWFGESFHCLPSSSHQHTSDTKDNCKQYHQWYNTQHYSKWNCTSWNIYFSLTWLASSYVWAIEKPVCWCIQHVICKIYISSYTCKLFIHYTNKKWCKCKLNTSGNQAKLELFCRISGTQLIHF